MMPKNEKQNKNKIKVYRHGLQVIMGLRFDWLTFNRNWATFFFLFLLSYRYCFFPRQSDSTSWLHVPFELRPWIVPAFMPTTVETNDDSSNSRATWLLGLHIWPDVSHQEVEDPAFSVLTFFWCPWLPRDWIVYRRPFMQVIKLHF